MARNKIYYEWAIEEREFFADGSDDYDIVDSDFADELAEYRQGDINLINNHDYRLCLIMHTGNEYDGEVSRYYAYTTVNAEGVIELGDRFDGSYYAIPQRFYKELSKHSK